MLINIENQKSIGFINHFHATQIHSKDYQKKQVGNPSKPKAFVKSYKQFSSSRDGYIIDWYHTFSTWFSE